MRLPKKFAQKSRKVFYWIHLWTGLILGLWLVAMGLTGSALSWKTELTEWETRQRNHAADPAPSTKHIPPSKVIAALKAYDPDLSPERGLKVPVNSTSYYLYSGRGEVNGERVTNIYAVNPVTAEVFPPVNQASLWIEMTEQFHHNLLVGVKGTVTNGFFTFFTVFMLLSGLWLWWPSTVKQFKQRMWLKRGQSLYRTLYDLHNISGIYLYGLLFIITLSGLIICYNGQTDQSIRKAINRWAGAPDSSLRREGDGREALAGQGRRGGQGGGREGGRGGREGAAGGAGGRAGGSRDGNPGASREGGRESRGREGGFGGRGGGGGLGPDEQGREPLPIDVMVEKVRAAWPERTLVSYRMPRRAGQPFQASYDFFSLTNTSVPFDPYTGERMATDPRPFSPGAKSMSVVFQLHYGWFAGNWSKIIYCISGFLPLSLFITGVWMYFNKKKTQNKNRKARLEREAAKANAGAIKTAKAAKPRAKAPEAERAEAELEEPVAVA